MKINKLIGIFALLLITWSALPNDAQAEFNNRKGHWQAGGGLGFTLSPTGFSLGLEMAYYATNNLQIVPRFSLVVPSGGVELIFAADARYVFDIKNSDLRALKPFVGLGAGVAVFASDNSSTAAFNLEIPIGLDYYINRELSIGTEMQHMILIGEFGGDFQWQWLVATMRYAF